MNCPHCGSPDTKKAGFTDQKKPRRRCNTCNRFHVIGAAYLRQHYTPEEDEILTTLAQAPNFALRYRRYARLKGWPQRTEGALRKRLAELGESRVDDTNGWITQPQLMAVLGLERRNTVTPSNWRANGLTMFNDGVWRCHLGDFARWALTPVGGSCIARALLGVKSSSSIEWLLWCIAEWKSTPSPVKEKKGAA